MSQPDIERLRALENDIEATDRLVAKSRKLNPDIMYGRVFIKHRDTILTLIAELGQEVGAVAPAWFYIRTPGADYDYSFTKTREEAIDLQDCDEPDEPIPLYASPAHTSGARDAARYRWLAENAIIQWPGVTHIGDDPASTRLPLDNAIDAAMRQEGGNG